MAARFCFYEGWFLVPKDCHVAFSEPVREKDIWILSLKSTNPILRLLFHDHAQPLPLKDTTSSRNLFGGEGFSTGVNLIIVGLSFLVPASWGCGRDYCQRFLQLSHTPPLGGYWAPISTWPFCVMKKHAQACFSDDKTSSDWAIHSLFCPPSPFIHLSFSVLNCDLWCFKKKPPRFGNSAQHSLSSWEQHTRASYRKG